MAVSSATVPTLVAETLAKEWGLYTRTLGAEVAATLVMRAVVGVLALAAVGLHCAAPTSDEGRGDATATPELVASPPRDDRQAPPAAASGAPSQGKAEPKAEAVDLTTLVHSGSAPHVTSSVYDEHGSLYATGTFVGIVSIGNTVIKSRGDKDVFLVKLDALGTFQWVRAVGSASAESAPRVTLESTGRISVIGMTNGEMDCGTGPLPTWSSDTFFLCIFGGDGVSLVSGVFPTGAP